MRRGNTTRHHERGVPKIDERDLTTILDSPAVTQRGREARLTPVGDFGGSHFNRHACIVTRHPIQGEEVDQDRRVSDPEGFETAEQQALEAGFPSHVALPIHAHRRLAKATGHDTDLDAELAESLKAMAIVHMAHAPRGKESAPYGPEQTAPFTKGSTRG